MFISHPHFYNADPALVNAVEGLHPSKDQHALFLDVHPVSEPGGASPCAGGPAWAGWLGGGACHRLRGGLALLSWH